MTTPAAPPDTRREPPETGDERAMLEGFLDFHRETLRWKCAGLTDEQLRAYSVRSSALTLLGLVRHITEVERWWFLPFVGEEPEPVYFTDEKPNDDSTRSTRRRRPRCSTAGPPRWIGSARPSRRSASTPSSSAAARRSRCAGYTCT